MRVRYRAPDLCPRNPDHIAGGTIHTLSRFSPGASVVFASAKSKPGTGLRLALVLLQALARLDPRWNILPDEHAITLHKNALGGPYLLLGDKNGPSLSFSHGEGRVWAAMCSKGSVGIDVAYPEEFIDDYPFARAFTPDELDRARVLCNDDASRGAALIWSAKEASVKATGAAFNLFDPLEVRVEAPLFREQGIFLEVSAGEPISAWARTENRGWLCVALAQLRPERSGVWS